MTKEDVITKLNEFFNNTPGYAGMIMDGFHNIAQNAFCISFAEYLKTGNNVLGEYIELVSLRGNINWLENNNGILDETQCEHYLNVLDNDKSPNYWNTHAFYTAQEIWEMQRFIYRQQEWIQRENEYKTRRRKACAYTGNKERRIRIFERDGEVCVHCGSTKNLTLDHIISVRNSGQNTLENLQVLCKSCNSKKSSK